MVVVGTHNLGTGGSGIAPSEFHVHPNWTASNWNAHTFVDMALIKLSTPVTNINPVLISSLDGIFEYL